MYTDICKLNNICLNLCNQNTYVIAELITSYFCYLKSFLSSFSFLPHFFFIKVSLGNFPFK